MAKLYILKDGRIRRDRRGNPYTSYELAVEREDLYLVGSTVSRGKAQAELTDQQAYVLSALMLAEKVLVTKDMLVEYIWPEPGTEPDHAWEKLFHQTCMLRKQLKPLGVGIKVYNGMGWELKL
jgi:DNA-binding winged helix-turn-helix (wHTH) protein